MYAQWVLPSSIGPVETCIKKYVIPFAFRIRGYPA